MGVWRSAQNGRSAVHHETAASRRIVVANEPAVAGGEPCRDHRETRLLAVSRRSSLLPSSRSLATHPCRPSYHHGDDDVGKRPTVSPAIPASPQDLTPWPIGRAAYQHRHERSGMRRQWELDPKP